MPRAIWKGTVAAEADHVETVEGNAYFPAEGLRDAAWTYRDPLPEAASIKDMVAVRRGVEVLA